MQIINIIISVLEDLTSTQKLSIDRPKFGNRRHRLTQRKKTSMTTKVIEINQTTVTDALTWAATLLRIWLRWAFFCKTKTMINEKHTLTYNISYYYIKTPSTSRVLTNECVMCVCVWYMYHIVHVLCNI